MPDESERSPLRHLGDWYFYEDWNLDAETWQGIVSNYVAEEPASTECIPAMGEISLVLATRLADSDVMYLYDQFKLNYAPPEGTDNEWLAELRDRIADELWSSREMPGSVQADVLSALATLEVRRPSNGDSNAYQTTARLGSELPIAEIVALLGSISLVLCQPSPIDPGTREWLETVRCDVATVAAERWPPTA